MHKITNLAALSQLLHRHNVSVIEQLRAEVVRLNAENEQLQRHLQMAEAGVDTADMYYDMYQCEAERNHILLTTAKRAGIHLAIPAIGMTKEGQVGLIGATA